MDSSLKTRIKKGFIWSTTGKIVYMLIGLSTNVFLARMLGPDVFGVLALLMFFVVISKVLSESGLIGALIRIKEPKDYDYSTVFFFNLTIAAVIYSLIFILSPYVSEYYGIVNLSIYLRVISIVILIDSFRIIQDARLVKQLNFKAKYKYELFAISISSVVGLSLAYLKFGIWALIFMQLSSTILLTSFLWIFEGGLPTYVFNKVAFKRMFHFGRNTTLASVINSSFDNIYQIIFAKFFSISLAGFYFHAKKLQEIPTNLVASLSMGVSYSALSEIQDDSEKFKVLYDDFVNGLSMIMGFIVLSIFLYAEQIIEFLYGTEWLVSVRFLKILIIAAFFLIQEIFNRIIFKIFDKTEMILKLEIGKKFILLITIIIGVYFSSMTILLYGILVTNIISYIVNVYVSKKIYSSFSYHDFSKTILLSLSIILIVLLFNLLEDVFNLTRYYSFYLLPIIIITYIYMLQSLKIFDFNNIKKWI